jgi:hypothetical protein
MKRRLLFAAIAFAAIVGGIGALDARAGQIALPTTMDQLLTGTGNFAILSVPPSAEADKFSDFTFSASAIPPTTPVLDASQVGISQFHLGNEDGISITGAMFAPAGTIVDYAISYIVTAPSGFTFHDAFLSGVFSTFGGTGSVSIGETLFDASTGALIGTLEASSPPGSVSDTINFSGVTSILVQKDIIMVGGSSGASVSIINQGYSSTGVPEPTSIALLGIGMTGFLAFRRFFKKTSVA